MNISKLMDRKSVTEKELAYCVWGGGGPTFFFSAIIHCTTTIDTFSVHFFTHRESLH